MQSLIKNGYSREEVINMLHSDNRKVKFRYDLLDNQDNKKLELKNVIDGKIDMKSLARIQRSGKFTIEEGENIDWLNDRVQPFIMFQMPDGKWIEWSLGIFLLSTPRRVESNQKVVRSVDAYDKIKILLDDRIDSRLTIPQGTSYINAITDLLVGASISKINIQYTDKVLRETREFEIGTEKLNIVNELLQEVNYYGLYVDENGYFTSKPYIVPSNRTEEYIYKNDNKSVLLPQPQEELDLFDIPNKFVVVQSNPESEPLKSIYENNNVRSKVSTLNRGRTIVDYREVDNIADQQSLDAYTERIANDASNVYGTVEFETALMPHHSFLDCIRLEYSDLQVSDKYIETSWSMNLQAGTRMKHTVRKVVRV